mmetsp:Transcript_13525/g.28712  ORF Transcript_13525/g.28712 Transcript_13525/m.28712 type:complete len:802 (+) Transcript_13525:183-2588(+)
MISAISNTAVVALWLSSAALAAVGVAAQDPPFTKEDMGCEYNPADGSACPRRYRISGGPGYTGERATWEHVASRETNMFCSPSCVEGGTANGECSLILAFHGIYSNPSDQHWLMMGHGAPEITYDESEASGGPFCISFHKAKGVAWDYTCNGDDAAHIEGFIHWALDEFPTLDPAAVNLHGFSSGGIQTMHLMDTRCPIEKLIAAAAPYGGGHMESPPTTKAAFLLAHGTHDNVVFYGEGWNEVTGTAVPTCARTDAGFFNNFQEFQNTWVQLFGEAITAGVAKYRGYTGDVYGPLPAKSGSIDLIDEAGRWNDKTCEAVKADCVIQNYAPSPFNDNFDCATLPAEETDIIDYPVSAGSKPVQLLKINIHNHDYPNRRRNGGPTEFFLYLRKFFNQNRGTRAPKQNQTVQDVGAEVCTDPDSFGEGLSFAYRRKVWDSSEPGGLTPEKCAELCKEDEECVEVFYIDYQPHYFDKACHLHYRFLPCTSTKSHSGPTSMHYVTSDAPMNPTKTPTPKPTPNPNSTPNPTPDPTPDPLSLCTQGGVLVPTNFGGYSCLEGLGDSNSGMTEEECNSLGGTWVPYNCQDADSFWKSVGGSSWEHGGFFGPEWERQCCSSEGVLSSTTDIGSVGIPGATTFNSDSLTTTLYASGADIWGTNDAFRFAYQTLDLDGSIYALVHPPSLSSDWEKSGLMIRQSLAANSAHASVFVTGANGVLSQYRPSTSAQSTGTHVDWYDRTTPIWLAIKRKQGRYISFWRSEDAVNWTQVGYTIDIPMGNTIHVGIAATAHNNNAIVEGKTQYFGIA